MLLSMLRNVEIPKEFLVPEMLRISRNPGFLTWQRDLGLGQQQKQRQELKREVFYYALKQDNVK